MSGIRYSPSQRIRWATKLREIWLADPNITMKVASHRAGGAPKHVAIDVRRKLRAEGKLPESSARDVLPEGLP